MLCDLFFSMHAPPSSSPPLSLPYVTGTGITSLSFMANVEQIDGFLRIRNCDSLSSLDGLQKLRTIGGLPPFGLSIWNNNLLQNIKVAPMRAHACFRGCVFCLAAHADDPAGAGEPVIHRNRWCRDLQQRPAVLP
jgi:hypothetical protein